MILIINRIVLVNNRMFPVIISFLNRPLSSSIPHEMREGPEMIYRSNFRVNFKPHADSAESTATWEHMIARVSISFTTTFMVLPLLCDVYLRHLRLDYGGSF